MQMISYDLRTSQDAEALVQYCKKYDEDIDVIYSRYVINAKSILGVISILGNMVTIDAHLDSEERLEEFKKGLEGIESRTD